MSSDGCGGCMYTQQTQNKATGVLNGRAGPIWDNHVCGRNGHKWSDMIDTENLRGMGMVEMMRAIQCSPCIHK